MNKYAKTIKNVRNVTFEAGGGTAREMLPRATGRKAFIVSGNVGIDIVIGQDRTITGAPQTGGITISNLFPQKFTREELGDAIDDEWFIIAQGAAGGVAVVHEYVLTGS